MKLLLPLLIISLSYTYGQELENLHFKQQVIYSVSFHPDSNDRETVRNEELELLINSEGSLFRSIEKGRKDSVYYATNEKVYAAIVSRPINKFSYEIFKRGDTIKIFDSAFGINIQNIDEIYYYSEPRTVFQWKLKEDTLRIGNLLCQRADVHYGGRDWIAWFAPEIPIQDGPYKFCGLPGLIISIYDTKNQWKFEMTAIRSVEKNVIVHFQDWHQYKAVNKKKLYEERRQWQDNLFTRWEARGANLEDPNDKTITHERARKEINRVMAKDNNWIELYR